MADVKGIVWPPGGGRRCARAKSTSDDWVPTAFQCFSLGCQWRVRGSVRARPSPASAYSGKVLGVLPRSPHWA